MSESDRPVRVPPPPTHHNSSPNSYTGTGWEEGGGRLDGHLPFIHFIKIGILQINCCRMLRVNMTQLKIGMIVLNGFSQHFKVEKSESENCLSYILVVKHNSFFWFLIKNNINLTILMSKDVFFWYFREFISRFLKNCC